MIRGVAPGQGRCAYISPLAWGYSPDGLSWADGGNTDSLPGGRPSGEDMSSLAGGSVSASHVSAALTQWLRPAEDCLAAAYLSRYFYDAPIS